MPTAPARRTWSKSLASWILLVAMAGTVTGCIWLRLLSFKNQLADLDHYARVAEHDGLTVQFTKPVLYGEDLFVFTQTRPSSAETNQNRQTWSWTYQKQPRYTNSEARDFDLTFQILLQDSKIAGLHFPERVLTVLPKGFLLGVLRSLGQAQIDRKHGSLTVTWVNGGPKEQIQPLSKAQVVGLLGVPFYAENSNGVYSCFYKYRFAGPGGESAWAKFMFAANSDGLASSEGVIGNVGWTLTAKPGQAGMQVALGLVPPQNQGATFKPDPATLDDLVGRYQDADGDVLSVGHDGDQVAVDGAGVTVELVRRGWWRIWATSPTHFIGQDMEFSFVRNWEGKTGNLVVSERGFHVDYAKISGAAPSTPPVVSLEPSDYDAVIGRYRPTWPGGENSIYVVAREGSQLLWAGIPIYPSSETNFSFKLVNSPLTFVKDSQGKVTKFVLHHSGQNLEALKLRP